MDKKIILSPNTFLWIRANKGLLYNTNSFNVKEFSLTGDIRVICESLLDFDNLYSTVFNDNDPEVGFFIDLVQQGEFGLVLDVSNDNILSLPPLLNLQFSVERMIRNDGLDIGENALTYLRTLTIYTGGVANDKGIVPVYDDNAEFFNENIFLTREDILGSQLSKREIFAHQSLNTTEFGQLTVMPDGLVYSSVNHLHIGKIDDDIIDIIVTELKQNYSWRRIRDSARCSKCLYQWLCPSPSNYEVVMQKECICND